MARKIEKKKEKKKHLTEKMDNEYFYFYVKKVLDAENHTDMSLCFTNSRKPNRANIRLITIIPLPMGKSVDAV